MNITNFTISEDRSQIDLTITDASLATSLKLWDEKTYKDFSKAVDLSLKLTGTATENIIITLSDLDISYFDGVYFIEVEDPAEVKSSITSDLTRYEECILNKLQQYSICEECLENIDINLINSQALLEGLKIAISNGFIDEILNIIDILNKYCSDDCKTCGDYDNIINNNYYSTNG